MLDTAGVGAVPEERDRLYRRVLWRILPILILLWICAWLDRTNVSLAKLQMASDLKLGDTAYGFGAGIFFLGYMLFQVPSNLVLLRIGVRRALALLAIGWGITSITMMFMRDAPTFYVLRFTLGAFEGGLYPGGLLYINLMLPNDRRGRAVALFSCAGSVAGIIGGPLAGMLMTRWNGLGGLAGWQWLFLVEGALSVVLGTAAMFILSNGLDDATWLTPEERTAIRADIDRDGAVIGPRQESAWRMVRHPVLWLFCLLYVCNNSGYTCLAFWAPTMLHDAGVADPVTIGWIMSAVSAVGAVAMYLAGGSARIGDPRRHFTMLMLCCSVGMLALGLVPPSALSVALGVIWTLTAAGMAVVVFWNLPNRFFSGTAIAVAIGLISGLSNIGAFFAPTMLGAFKQNTGSLAPGLWVMAACYGVAFLATFLLARRSEVAH